MSELALQRNPLALLSLRQQLLYTLAINAMIGLLLVLLLRQSLGEALLYSNCVGLGFFACFFAYSRLFRFRLATVWLPLLLGGTIGLTIAIVVSGLMHDYALAELVTIIWREQRALLANLFGVLLLGGVGLYVLLSVARAVAAKRALQQARIRQLEADKLLVQSQLQLLQAQIEPHFLFNTLSTIGALIDTTPQQGKAMLEHFTRYLRTTLRRSRAGSASLDEELSLVGDYLALMQMRLGGRLHYSIEAAAPLRTALLPPMLLQPLVENAVRHGIEPAAAGGSIAIDAGADGDTLRIRITDSGIGLPPEPGSGFGLTNIRERLHSLYGARGRLTIHDYPPHGVQATIEIPYDKG